MFLFPAWERTNSEGLIVRTDCWVILLIEWKKVLKRMESVVAQFGVSKPIRYIPVTRVSMVGG